MILAPLVLLSLFLMQGMEWVWQWVEHLQYLIINEYMCGCVVIKLVGGVLVYISFIFL